jgi:hypothetical protein
LDLVSRRGRAYPRGGLALSAACAVACALAGTLRADTIVVAPAGGGDFRELQAAVDAAEPGDIVLARAGEHLVCAPLTFRGKAITVLAEAGPGATVIRRCAPPDELEPPPIVLFQDGEGAGAVLEGFTVAGDLDDLSDFRLPGGAGGGIRCDRGSSPAIRSCHVIANGAERGGGIACLDGSSPTISRSRIAWNVAFGGGGIYSRDSSPLIEDSIVLGNMAAPADTGGSGVLLEGGSPRLSRTRIVGNGDTCGSALHADGGSPLVENCLIYGNDGFALEVGCVDCVTPMFIHCTISGNFIDGSVCHGNVPSLFLRSIVWTRGSRFIWDGGPLNVTGEDPLFVSEGVIEPGRRGTAMAGGREIRGVLATVIEEPDFRLRVGSPAIDRETGPAPPPAPAPSPATDFDGKPRPCRVVDDGAFEFLTHPDDDADADGIPDECEDGRRLPGDCNGDASLDVSDPICVLGHLFLGEGVPLSCGRGTIVEPGNIRLLDHNGDSRVSLTDGILPLLRLFSGGTAHVLGEDCAPIPGCQELPAECPQ